MRAVEETKKEFLKIFNEMCYSRSAWQVWADLMSVMACSIANAVDKREEMWSAREKEYEECIKRLGGVLCCSHHGARRKSRSRLSRRIIHDVESGEPLERAVFHTVSYL